MKVAELEGAMLDYWVARAEGATGKVNMMFMPSTNWAQAGPIIEREGIGVWQGYDSDSRGKVEVWEAADGSPVHAIEVSGPMGEGPTPLIAAMRAYVRLKFGKEVQDTPSESMG